MAKAKRQSSSSSSASRRREEVRKQRQQPRSPQSSDNRNKRYRQSNPNRNSRVTVGVVLLVIAVIIGIFVFLSRQSSTSGSITPPTPVSASVLSAVTNVSPSILASVGTGGQQKLLTPLKGAPPLKGSNGKPEFFYNGAEYCPFCAAQRWAVVVALSRFGTFNKLNQTTSSATDSYPNTSTFTFYRSSYTSQYIDFVSVEETTNQPDSSGNGYTPLQTPTADQQKLVSTYDAPPYLSSAGSIPFIDIANQHIMQGANYSPQVLAGLSWDAIANDLSNQNSDVTKGIVGSANYLTAAICMATNQQPASVCTAAPIPQIEQSIGQSTSNVHSTQLSFLPEAVLRKPE